MSDAANGAMSAVPAPAPAETGEAGGESAGSRAAGLDRSLVQGIAWTSAVKWTSQVLTWASTLVVARLLTPDDYGLVGMATLYLGLVTLLSEFGFGAAVVTLRDLGESEIGQIHALSILFGIVGYGLSCLAAVPLGWFFDAPRLPLVVVVMSVTFVITAIRTVPQSLLQRDLSFRLLALIEGSQAIVTAVTTMILALVGMGYWTLVLGPIVGTTLATGVTLAIRPQRPRWPRYAPLRRAVEFSAHIITSRLAWYAYSNADFLVVGRVLGQTALGVYSIGWTLATIPVNKVSAIIVRVTPAFFAAVQDDAAALRRYVLLLTESLATVTFPATIGIALVADDFVHLALGAKWAGAIAPLQLLALYAAFRSISPLLPQVLNVTGESRFQMRNGLLAAVVLPIGFFIGSRYGGVGVASVWLFVHPLLMLPLLLRIRRRIGLTIGQYLRALWPAASASAVMGGAVWLVQLALPATAPLAVRLGAQVAAGAVSYVGFFVVAHRSRLAALKALVRQIRSRDVAPAARPAPAGES